MNLINYSPYQFDDTSIVSGSVAMENALMFDSLQPDELTVEVISNDTGKRKLLTVDHEWYTTVNNRGYVLLTNDIRNFTYGDPVLYYYDGVLQGKYFIRSVERLSVDHFRLSAYSAVGLWTNIQHFGGIYSGTTAGTIIADLLTGFTYSIDPDVAAVPMYGYLPIASIRDNLRQVLFAIGASLVKDSNGDPKFVFLNGLSPVAVSDERIYIGGKLTYKTPATEVVVTEHSYYESAYDIQVSLFDNTDGSGTASNKLVTFKNPCHNLATTGTLTINSYGANHAYVTGTGVLSGYEYTHTTKVFSVPTGVQGETNTATIDKATLLSPANSANIAARVAAYNSTAEEVSYGIVMDNDDIKPTSLISFTDPYGDASQGIIATMNITMSGKSKADCKIVKGYVPSHFGNNFENVALITSSTTWTIPAGKEIIRVVLGQGGQAGQNGFDGEDGYTPTFSFDPAPHGGTGGGGGAGGSAGKVFVTDIHNPSGTITFTIGAGGTAGSGSGALGNEGGHSTANYNGAGYTSADGAIPNEGYRDVLNGITYSEIGVEGLSGADGGVNSRGQDYTYNGTTWVGGAMGQGYRSNGSKTRYANGGSGGGAAYGADGNNGGDYHWHSAGQYVGYYTGGAGGDGADASQLSYTPNYGSGGIGGCGGGGGGTGGYYYYENASSQNPDYDAKGYASDGSGGAGSNGGTGGGGYALVFY